jgi:hypothetical protein
VTVQALAPSLSGSSAIATTPAAAVIEVAALDPAFDVVAKLVLVLTDRSIPAYQLDDTSTPSYTVQDGSVPGFTLSDRSVP